MAERDPQSVRHHGKFTTAAAASVSIGDQRHRDFLDLSVSPFCVVRSAKPWDSYRADYGRARRAASCDERIYAIATVIVSVDGNQRRG